MNRRIKLTFVEENVSCIAELLDDKAPQTADMIWNLLESPMENHAIHAMYTGREFKIVRIISNKIKKAR